MVLIQNNGETEIKLSWESWTFIITPGNTIKVSAPVAQAILRRFPNAAQVEGQPSVPAPQSEILPVEESGEVADAIDDLEASLEVSDPVSTEPELNPEVSTEAPPKSAPAKVSPAQIRNEARKNRKR